MPRGTQVVTQNRRRRQSRGPVQLPDGFGWGAVLVEWLIQSELWQQIAQKVRLHRRAGSYSGIDVVLFMLLFFAWPKRESLKDFGQICAPFRKALGALGGRRILATPSSISRGLKAVDERELQQLNSWMLVQASDSREVLRHPAAAHYDTQGQPWHLFDWDGTRKGIRQRGLAQGPQYPRPQRWGPNLGAPGYTGRKRGELVLGRAVLQHAGSGLWIHMHQAAGYSETTAGLQAALTALVDTMHYADLPLHRAVLRCDGSSGNVPAISVMRSNNINALVRLSTYRLFDQPIVVERMRAGSWVQVPSSGSGPTRYAMDLGMLRLVPGAHTRQHNGEPYEPLQIRVVVSRFKCADGKSGAGHVRDGYQYELYGADLPADCWPAPEVVELYYGREAEENSFAQEDRELELDRIFHQTPAGQFLATLLGLWSWNLAICRGYAFDPPPSTVPKPRPRKVLHQHGHPTQQPLPPAPRATSTASAQQDEDTTCCDADQDEGKPAARLVQLVRPLLEQALDGRRALKQWSMADDGLGFICPQGVPLPLGRVYKPRDGAESSILRFLAPAPQCRRCIQRPKCGRAISTRFVKRLAIAVDHEVADEVDALMVQERQRRNRLRKRPPIGRRVPCQKQARLVHERHSRSTLLEVPIPETASGPSATMSPLLMSSVLRKCCKKIAATIAVTVTLQVPRRVLPHPALAQSAEAKHRRRQTWAQRLVHNRLPDKANVSIRFIDRSGKLAALLPETAQ